MKAKVITGIMILTLISTTFAQDANTQEKIHDLHKEMITVPLYENHIKDYRVSQTVRYGVKWTSIGSIPLTFLVMNDAHEDCEFICAAVVLSAAVLIPVAGAGGSAYGYFHGKRLNKIKKSDPEYFTEAFSFGTYLF